MAEAPAPLEAETRVRWATPEDAATIVEFVRGLAAFASRTVDWNRARAFYERLAFTQQPEWPPPASTLRASRCWRRR